MTKLITAVLVGLLLGITTTATAASVYWKRGGSTYMCEGADRAVFCKETNWKPSYTVGIIPRLITVSFGGKIVFACDRGIRPDHNCQSFVPGP